MDVVCANAGVSEIGSFLEAGAEDGEPKKPGLKTLDINLVGTLYCMHTPLFYFPFSPSGLYLTDLEK